MFIRKRHIILTCILIFSLLLTVGCQSETPETDPGPVPEPNEDPVAPVDVPHDPGPEDPVIPEDPVPPEDPGPDPITQPTPVLNAPVNVVPEAAAGQGLMAVLRLGDLWLLAEDGQAWRQTETGNVADVLWAPNGHGLAYTLRAEETKDLYYLIPGGSPVLMDRNVQLITSWPNSQGVLWSPDSTKLAYAIAGGEQLRVTDLDMEKESFPLDNKVWQGPYWLSEDVLVYGARVDSIPATVMVSSTGEKLREWTQAAAPYAYPGGALAATGPFSSEGPMLTDYSGLARVTLEADSPTPFYDQSVRHCYLDYFRDQDDDILTLGNGEHLILQQESQDEFSQSLLMTQDILITYSEFLYPVWFDWSPDRTQLAALRFTLTKAKAQMGGQEGYWDLLLIDRDGNQLVLLEEIYTVVNDQETNNPLWETAPISWSPCGGYVYYVVKREDRVYDLWRVDVADGETEIVLEFCELPQFRPAAP